MATCAGELPGFRLAKGDARGLSPEVPGEASAAGAVKVGSRPGIGELSAAALGCHLASYAYTRPEFPGNAHDRTIGRIPSGMPTFQTESLTGPELSQRQRLAVRRPSRFFCDYSSRIVESALPPTKGEICGVTHRCYLESATQHGGRATLSRSLQSSPS